MLNLDNFVEEAKKIEPEESFDRKSNDDELLEFMNKDMQLSHIDADIHEETKDYTHNEVN